MLNPLGFVAAAFTLASIPAALPLPAISPQRPTPAQPSDARPEGWDDQRPHRPVLTVTGSAEVSAAPDRAVVTLGAVAQSPEAAAAQEQVNQVMTDAIEAIRQLEIPQEAVSTTGISLQPVYSHDRPRQARDEPTEPSIVAFRASNTLRIVVADLSRVGDVIDAGIAAGTNQVQGLSFELSDDTEARAQALQIAAKRARGSARAIAAALEVELGEVWEVTESSGDVYPVQRGRMMAMEAAVSTPVEPGQVRVNASVTVTWRIEGK